MASPRVTPLQPSETFAGDFRVVKPLSQGGFGAVYVVAQVSTGKLRALKLMHPKFAEDARFRERFEQEARIGSRIASEHVVEVIGAGVDGATGAPWLAMELLQGEDLGSLVERVGALASDAMLAITEQICHAVGAAHAATPSIVHRDLKPANIFVAEAKRADATFMVKVLDFGIAKIVAEAKTTQTQGFGSPGWWAPEQTRSGAFVGPQTDVWAIGLIVFHLITARLFWRTAEDENGSDAQLLREMVLDPMPLASVRAREVGLAAVLPPGFDTWFARSTDRSPRARFANAIEQFRALQALYERNAQKLAPTVPSPESTVAPTFEQKPLPLAIPLSSTVPYPQAPVDEHETPPLPPQPDPAPPRRARALGTVGLSLVVATIAILLAGVGTWLRRPIATRNSETPLVAPPRDATPSVPGAASPSPAALPSQRVESPPTNPWVRIEPPPLGATVRLGLDREHTKNRGLRPSRQRLAPSYPYEIQAHEVTWQECRDCPNNPCNQVHDEGGDVSSRHDREPAVGIGWSQAESYCEALGGRLPQEDEWEYAARGPALRPNPWGSEPKLERHEDFARLRLNAFGGQDAAVGPIESSDNDRTPANGVGVLIDMAGNAQEWTFDAQSGDSAESDRDDREAWRVVKGLPLKQPTEWEPPIFSAAWRTNVCIVDPCPAWTLEVASSVGFRCMRRMDAATPSTAHPDPATPSTPARTP